MKRTQLLCVVLFMWLGGMLGGCLAPMRGGIRSEASLPTMDSFSYMGVARQLFSEDMSKPARIVGNITLPKGLTGNEWQSIQMLIARIPDIDREIVAVIGWEDPGVLMIVRVQTPNYLIYLIKDSVSQSWKVNAVHHYDV